MSILLLDEEAKDDVSVNKLHGILVQDEASLNEMESRISQFIQRSEKEEGILYCVQCHYSTPRLSHLKEHIENHLEDFLHPCKHCQQTFKTRKRRRHHIDKAHLNKVRKSRKQIKIGEWQCDNCMFNTHNKSYLENHMGSCHLS
eukprot:TRINITY_DN25587_c0_g1_i1.p1 TRINITY_DN25587_c0_g1~~TRINITY_DN25587_c0_g1_i1.p1  ORF type:complete len:144 (-),score=5.31 TRINITY_DN25587_c0_g1_i1:53-484(-)